MISTALRNFNLEPTKDELTHIYLSIPPSTITDSASNDIGKMNINAVLSLGDVEDESYAGLMPLYLSFASLDRKSVRFTIPRLATIRRVERIYSLSVLT
ncbi:hypothetical protein F5887DRAFT_120058 [Amanita rubescens]|nr:hypothetical protein F5887DRAFT_120058 [Amanita rubescens]